MQRAAPSQAHTKGIRTTTQEAFYSLEVRGTNIHGLIPFYTFGNRRLNKLYNAIFYDFFIMTLYVAYDVSHS